MHTTTPHVFRQLGPWARRTCHLIACWSGSALLASALAAGHGYRPVAVLATEQGDQLNGELLQGAAGELYVTALSGGAHGHGAVTRVSLAGEVTTLHSFRDRRDGGAPDSGLIRGSDGWLYGSTRLGGAAHQGVIYRMSPEGVMTTLHSFERHADGAFPSRLLQARDGNFYGTTKQTGFDIGDTGAAYRLTPGGQYTVLRVFDAALDGAQPDGALIQAADGDFYGTTTTAGPRGGGTVFRLKADGTLELLHAFSDNHRKGEGPRGALLEGQGGMLYGSTGHFNGPATVFRIRPN